MVHKIPSLDPFAEMLGNFQHNPDRVPAVLRSAREMSDYFRDRLAEQRHTPRPGLVHSLLTFGALQN